MTGLVRRSPTMPFSLPMLASPQGQHRIESLEGSHMFDVKLDGVRAIVMLTRGQVTAVNRNGVYIHGRYPELAQCPLPLPDALSNGECRLDGEIVALDGSFESLAFRDRQSDPRKIAAMAKQIPVKFVAFDVLALNGYDIRDMTYEARRSLLDGNWPEGRFNDSFATSVISANPGLLDLVADLGMEGVIAKRMQSHYRSGRSKEWIKFKITHRVSCVPTGYAPGQGARAEFGAMYLSMLGPDGPVSVGRVGTGFTDADIKELKSRLDRDEVFVVEIETLNQTKNGTLRFPVFKGIRTDVDPQECRVSQLEALPTC